MEYGITQQTNELKHAALCIEHVIDEIVSKTHRKYQKRISARLLRVLQVGEMGGVRGVSTWPADRRNSHSHTHIHTLQPPLLCIRHFHNIFSYGAGFMQHGFPLSTAA